MRCERKGVVIRKFTAACMMLALAVLTACGGGGGGGGGVSTGAAAGSYTGVSSQATITASNAVALSADAYTIGAVGSGLNIAAVASQPAGVSSSALTEVAAVIKTSAATALKAQLAGSSSLAGYVAASSISGPYGGSASFTININETSNYFVGSMTFSNYRDTFGGPVISGTVTMAGSYNPQTGSFNTLTIAFSPLSATSSTNTLKLYGAITYTVNNSGEVMQISCTVDVNGTVYWIKDWTFTYSIDGTVTVTGRYYHPAYGYVAMSTQTPIIISSATGEALSGSLLFGGANGTQARVTFGSSGNSVSVDAQGNGQWVQVR